MPCCKFHNRLDMKLSVHEYTAAACGSLSLPQAGDNIDRTDGTRVVTPGPLLGKPHYCCFDCPVLLAKHATT